MVLDNTAFIVGIVIMGTLVGYYMTYIFRMLAIEKKHKDLTNTAQMVHVSMPDGACYFYDLKIPPAITTDNTLPSFYEGTLTLDATHPSTLTILADLRSGAINRVVFPNNNIYGISAGAVNRSTVKLTPLEGAYSGIFPPILDLTHSIGSINSPINGTDTNYRVLAWKE